MDDAVIYFGQRVKYLRLLRKLTQAELAEKIDLSVNYISQIETGVASPTFKTISMLAQGLDVEIKELFDFEHVTKDRFKARSRQRGSRRKK